jgi:hypothetical protein
VGFVVDKLALRIFLCEDVLFTLPVYMSPMSHARINLPLKLAVSRHVDAPGGLIIWRPRQVNNLTLLKNHSF